MAAGFKQGLPGVTCRLIPMADGGEGTVTAWAAATGAALMEAEVHDPLGRLVVAQYGRDDERHLAVIEMAAASGLPLLTLAERNPLLTSTTAPAVDTPCLSTTACAISCSVSRQRHHDGGAHGRTAWATDCSTARASSCNQAAERCRPASDR